jgi:Predicted transcription factor, homolog of eukaryotic MBF1
MSTDTLARLIRTRRDALGMKQGELAAAIGTSPAYMSQIEKGRSTWPQNLVPALSKVLGVSEVEMAIAAGLLSPDAATQDRHANPFAPDDPRWQLVEKLKQVDIEATGATFTLKAMGELLALYTNDPDLFTVQSKTSLPSSLDMSASVRNNSTNH